MLAQPITQPGTAYVVGVQFPFDVPGYGRVEDMQGWRLFLTNMSHRAQAAQANVSTIDRLEDEVRFLKSENKRLANEVKPIASALD